MIDEPSSDEIIDLSKLADGVDGEDDGLGGIAFPGETPRVNIAELMDETALQKLGGELISLIESDIESRRPWGRTAEKGLKALGLLTDETNTDTDGGTGEENQNAVSGWQSRVVHPVLNEAVIRSASTAAKELFPPEGPAKPHVLGKAKGADLRAQAERQANYINWLYTCDDAIPDAGDEHEKLLMASAREGDVFREPYWDDELGAPDIATISASDLIMPYTARSVYRSPRVTHRMRQTMAWVRDWQDSGYFRGIKVYGSSGETRAAADKERDRIQGKSPQTGDLDDDAAEIVVYKCTTHRKIPEDQIAAGKRAAYLIWLTEHGDVLAIYPDWVDDGNVGRRRWRYASWPFLVLDGCVYGLGLYHIIGYLAETATDCLRAILDSARAQNWPAWFASAEIDLGKVADKGPVAPGEVRQLPFAGADFKAALHQVNFGSPSPVLMQLLGAVVDTARRLASTADMMVGDAKNTGPVGTTVALIEQGSVVYSAIHARLHRSQRREMRLLSRVIYEHISDDAIYPYEVVESGEDVPIRPDFDGRVDVEPVSDPRIFSKTQRLAREQATLQLVQTAPDLFDRREVYRRMLEALEEDNIDKLLPPPDAPQRMDAMSENMAMLYGKAVAVFPDQDHVAHAAIHGAVKTDPRFIALFQTLPPEMQAQAQARLAEHEAQHLAWDYKNGLVAQIGMLSGGDPSMVQGLLAAPEFAAPVESDALHPPEVERHLDQLAAAAIAVQQEQQSQMMLAQQVADLAATAQQQIAGGGAPGALVQ